MQLLQRLDAQIRLWVARPENHRPQCCQEADIAIPVVVQALATLDLLRQQRLAHLRGMAGGAQREKGEAKLSGMAPESVLTM